MEEEDLEGQPLEVYKGLGVAILLTGTDMDGLKKDDPNTKQDERLARCTVRIKSLPVKMVDGLPTSEAGGDLYRLKRSNGVDKLVQDGVDKLAVGDETTIDLSSCTGLTDSSVTTQATLTLTRTPTPTLTLTLTLTLQLQP